MSLLTDELAHLPSHLVYQGGSAPGVRCATCGTDATSGSWRRGWELQDRNCANLCNKCGQRRVKLIRAQNRSHSGQPGSSVNPRPPLPVCHSLSGLSSGPAAGSPSVPSLAGVKRSFAVFDPTNVSNTHRPSIFQRRGSSSVRPRLRSESTSSEASGTSEAERGTPPLFQNIFRQQRPYGVGYEASETPGYCIQKLTDGRANYALFWVLKDTAKEPTLAAIGYDSRQSGHFQYWSAPTAPAPPLHCTNRSDVIAWMTTHLGVNPKKSLAETDVMLPQIGIQDIRAMLGQAPSPYQSPDIAGRGAGIGLSGSLSGALTPTSPALLGAPDSQPSPQPLRISLKLDRGAKVKPGGGPAPSGTRPPATVPSVRFRCGACGQTDHNADKCPLGCISPPTLIQNPVSQAAGAGLEGLLLPGLGDQDTLDIDLLFGDVHVEDDDSPMQDTAFDTFLDFSFGPAGGLVGSAEPSPGGAGSPAVTQPPRTGHQESSLFSYPQNLKQKQQQQSPAAVQRPGQPTAAGGHLSSSALEETLRAWAAALDGAISEAPPTSTQQQLQGGSSGRWVPLGEALTLLHHLSALEVSMEMLERTKILHAVLRLRSHANLFIASAAQELAARWKTCAEKVCSAAAAGYSGPCAFSNPV